MPDIEVTEDQRERLRNVEEALAAEVVGKYGVVRTRDAIEYLLDRFESDGRIEAAVVDAHAGAAEIGETDETATDDADVSDDSDDEAREEPAEDESAESDEDADDADEDEDDADEDEDDADDDEDDADDGEESADEDEDEDEDEDDAETAANGGGDMLSAMQSLLDDHDDKWGEGSGDDRYEVELPDGSTESARTKDDVRALLFQHYR